MTLITKGPRECFNCLDCSALIGVASYADHNGDHALIKVTVIDGWLTEKKMVVVPEILVRTVGRVMDKQDRKIAELESEP
jgi:hypothetical protein